jgi:hypothetical protein
MRLKVISPLALYAALGLFAISPQAAEPPVTRQVPGPPGAADTGKGDVERGPQAVAAALTAAARTAAGRGKGAIELGPQHVAAATAPTATPAGKSDFVNPKVEPGKVKWHADFDTACKASAKSGKPVLLFQMMGKLDDQFC